MLRKTENSSYLIFDESSRRPKGTLNLEIVMFYKYYAPTVLFKTDKILN